MSTLVRDPQQKKTLSLLQHAGGAEVSYDELREAGIEFPATAVSELELSGVPVEHGRRLQHVSWRLDPHWTPGPGTAVATPARKPPQRVEAAAQWTPARVYGRRAADRLTRLSPVSRSGLWGALALLAAAITVGVLVLSSVSSGGPPVAHRARSAQVPTRPAARQRHIVAAPGPSRHVTHGAAPSSAPPPALQPATTTSPPAPTTASALESRGHALLQAGQYASAIPILQEAVRATGESASACAQPTTQNCLTYAYALFDLGRALRLSGDPQAAVPVLQLRLGINNQRGAVAQELALAQGSSSSTSASALEARGHQLLASGAYGSAIPVLQQAVQASGESPTACAQPTTQSCLTYAYALFDLGRALRLSGDPQAAVPILKERLEINNQRGAVAYELSLAESAASG